MNEQAYELTALAMRYWFTALILVACLCGLRLQIAERKRARREKLAAPNMEYVGELLVVRGSESVPRGERYAVQRDFVIGRRRKCDVCLADKSVFPRHARGELRNGGMLIGAIGRAPVALRGQPLSQEVLVKDGALFCIGALTLQLTLYDVPVEYVPSQSRAIDAADVQGDQFDVEAPFEHEFDDEYGPQQRDTIEQDPDDIQDPDDMDEAAPDTTGRYGQAEYSGTDYDAEPDNTMGYGGREYDDARNASGAADDGYGAAGDRATRYNEAEYDAVRPDAPSRGRAEYAAAEYAGTAAQEPYAGNTAQEPYAGPYADEYASDDWDSTPDAEYNRELVQQRPAQDEQPFKPITIARTHSSRRSTQRPSDDYDDDDDYGDDSTGSYEYAEDPESECELDEYEEYALETGADEPLNDSEQDHAGHTASKYPPTPVRHRTPTAKYPRPSGQYAAAGQARYSSGPDAADELEDYPGRPGAIRRAQRAQGGAQLPGNDHATQHGRVRRS